MIRYAWTPGRSFKVSAQIVGEELEQIERSDGRITPAAVVDRARSANNILHRFFEWDDKRAADAHRLDQARNLIQCVVVKSLNAVEPTRDVRAFVNIMGRDSREYLGIGTVMSDGEKRKQLLSRAKAELDQWRERYRGLQEFARVFDAIDQVAAA